MQLTDDTLPVGGRRLAWSLAAPEQPVAQPGLLLTFASTRQSALTEAPYTCVVEAFLSAGHYVASFNLPNHGDRVDRFGQGIEGMAAAFLAGHDPFSAFVRDGQALLDRCLNQGIGSAGRIAVCGESRGAYCALRLFASDKRITAAAGLAPVTDWRVLQEFWSVANDPVVASLALDNWAPDFAGRPLYLAIGHHDARVGTAKCIRLALRVVEAERDLTGGPFGQLHVVDAPGHTLTDPWRYAGAQFLLEMIGRAEARPNGVS